MNSPTDTQAPRPALAHINASRKLEETFRSLDHGRTQSPQRSAADTETQGIDHVHIRLLSEFR